MDWIIAGFSCDRRRHLRRLTASPSNGLVSVNNHQKSLNGLSWDPPSHSSLYCLMSAAIAMPHRKKKKSHPYRKWKSKKKLLEMYHRVGSSCWLLCTLVAIECTRLCPPMPLFSHPFTICVDWLPPCRGWARAFTCETDDKWFYDCVNFTPAHTDIFNEFFSPFFLGNQFFYFWGRAVIIFSCGFFKSTRLIDERPSGSDWQQQISRWYFCTRFCHSPFRWKWILFLVILLPLPWYIIYRVVYTAAVSGAFHVRNITKVESNSSSWLTCV